MAMTVRLPEELDAQLDEIARSRHTSKHAILIEAATRFANTETKTERVLSIGRIEADGATNVVPDDVRLEGTLRTFDEALRCASYDAIRDIAASAVSPSADMARSS